MKQIEMLEREAKEARSRVDAANKKAACHLTKCFDDIIEKIGFANDIFYRRENIEHGLGFFNHLDFYLHDVRGDGEERMWYHFSLSIDMCHNEGGQQFVSVKPSVGCYSDGFNNAIHRNLFIAFGRVIENYDYFVSKINDYEWEEWKSAHDGFSVAQSRLDDARNEIRRKEREMKLRAIAEQCIPGVRIVIGERKEWMEGGRMLDHPKRVDVADSITAVTPKKYRFENSGLIDKEKVHRMLLDGAYRFANVA